MTASPTLIAAAGVAVVVVTWVRYLATIPSGRVPIHPVGSVVAQLVGIGLGLAAVGFGVRQGAVGGGTIALTSFAVVFGSFFLWLLSQRKTPVGDIKVGVGDVLPGFVATASDGSTFDTEHIRGQRVLLKFFRGGW